ncbi:M48 family metallopeptidase [Ovoidimarina sediminis]|uniref:M48 family metallopeptidase n=1 Tax=Ovoidimarina sediminis TaxID=3079856 RepID=UPI00290F9CB4|nr:M48 family metallopeptidase [Rhodophyticola sp. MJ-SS7]MDU8943016.1 M48 family metallopeptidase [Rhodophyticola sp. MJ-SS7]
MRRLIALVSVFFLSACVVTPVPTGPAPGTAPSSPPPVSATRASAAFTSVVERVGPVAVQVCRERTRNTNCNFRIVVDDRPGLPPNAFQTLDRQGRPVIGFTVALINDARNADELAFVLGHEAAHHIRGHIPQSQQRAVEGALLGTVVGALIGLEGAALETAQRAGGTINSRRFSKEFELQADALGTIIAARAGYDPVRGAQFFARIPDPGDRFLGTHPPNADRIATVKRTAAGL